MSLLPTIHLFLIASGNPSSRFCVCPERLIDEKTPLFPVLVFYFPYTVPPLQFVLFFMCVLSFVCLFVVLFFSFFLSA